MSKSEGWVLLFLLASYYLLHLLQSRVIDPEWLRYHGKDLIFIPTLLLSAKGAAALIGRELIIGFRQIIAAVIYTAVVFEWLLPTLSEKYVSDWIDVGAYVLGAGHYYVISRYTLNQ
jgi:hypothetical protein